MTQDESDLPGPIDFTVPTADGATLQAFAEGQGRVLLLVSGLGGTAAFWTSISATLARSFRVIRFDQRGIAASTRGKAACSIDELARDCLALLDQAGVERAMVLGHSTGGCIAQALARQAPERIDGLILSGGWLKPSRYMAGYFGARRAILESNPEAYAASSVLCAYPPAWIEANWHVFEAALAAAPATAQAQAAMRERIDALLSFDGSAEAAALAMPILVLGARDDMVVPAFLQEELAAALPGCSKTMLDTGGHLFPVSRPDAFTATVADWIGRLG
ncbi:alpha/beta fold hydrolase [Bosea sp. 124]|uniref:alpha/beta fold hydrolase n=1 Tax=Bosea sp. 124 TaxID=2135642 RepID=UPI000D38EA81|nr:alpha/beta fold hydrolase [Bosea sp. 124]PTM39904.1 pimeloyl-ACP methyl ester carboxylesterase [Bosea sp. 124]